MLADTAHLVISMLFVGIALIFLHADRANPVTRALSACLMATGLATLFANGTEVNATTISLAMLSQLAEGLAILFGLEWGRRIALTNPLRNRVRLATQGLLRASQIIIGVHTLLSLGYILLFPEYGAIDPEGVVKVRAIEFAVFAPLLGTAMLLAGIAIVIMLSLRIDSIERIRLHALLLAGPLFMLTLMFRESIEPLLMALGFLVFLGGSVRYLTVQAQRGLNLRRFVSDELSDLVDREGVASARKRERRDISVVSCDLRGFTAFARTHDSDTVVSLLEDYYQCVGEIADRCGGTVKDHAGDGVLILVGAPRPDADHARTAVILARTILEAADRILLKAPEQLGIGIGIATGEATIGAIEGAGRLEYVAVGNVVNLAARLCDRASDREILLDQRTCQQAELAEPAIERPPEPLKGYAEAVPIYALPASLSLSTGSVK